MTFQPIAGGSPVTGNLATRDSQGYKILVGAGQKLIIRLDGPDDADFDLYVRYGQEVSLLDYDFKRITQQADEALTIGPTQEGQYFILVYAYRGEGNFSLNTEIVHEEITLRPGQQVSGEIEAGNEARYFRIPITKDERLILNLNGPLEADLDLYLRFGQRPSNVQYDQRSISGSSKESITVETTQEGDYYAMVYSYRGTGRFTLGAGSGHKPILAILTSKGNLESKYGTAVFQQIEERITAYAQSVGATGQEASIIYVDDADNLAPYGLNPVDPQDASAVKKLLDLLDRAIHAAAFLIVGGHDIIPFHVIPNPCGDDGDTQVFSDNPYASRDEDMLIPERAMTRMPDDASTDGSFFIALLEQAAQRTQGSASRTFGLSAKVWQGASNCVYQEIEPGGNVKLSPPIIYSEIDRDWINGKKYYYFNLHGSEETENWYGQEAYHYPVAFNPGNLDDAAVEGAVICCEACYGANIIDKRADEALALTFLLKNAACFVGSTKIAYGPSDPPCYDADLIVIKFYQRVIEGLPFGQAFVKAKEDFARESIRTKGYLDKTDEKTLLEFVIYADPLGVA